MNNATRTTIAALLDVLNDSGKESGLVRSDLAALANISYSRTCGVIQDYPEYFATAGANVLALTTSKNLPDARGRTSARVNRREQFEGKLLDSLADIAESLKNRNKAAPVENKKAHFDEALIAKALKHAKKIGFYDHMMKTVDLSKEGDMVIFSVMLCFEHPDRLKIALDGLLALAKFDVTEP